jgi:predicted ATPase
MKRYILTGAPGSGKTSLIRALEMKGYCVVEEAATDVIAYEQDLGIAAPWQFPDFIDKIVSLQKQRQWQAEEWRAGNGSRALQFYDRSPFWTYALACYLGFEPSSLLIEEIARIQENKVYEKPVFFIENLGFIKHTEARKISFEESLKFEKIHNDVYTQFGYDCIKIASEPLSMRADNIIRAL